MLQIRSSIAQLCVQVQDNESLTDIDVEQAQSFADQYVRETYPADGWHRVDAEVQNYNRLAVIYRKPQHLANFD